MKQHTTAALIFWVIVISITFASVVGGWLNSMWMKECIQHKAAHYEIVGNNGNTVFTWNQ